MIKFIKSSVFIFVIASTVFSHASDKTFSYLKNQLATNFGIHVNVGRIFPNGHGGTIGSYFARLASYPGGVDKYRSYPKDNRILDYENKLLSTLLTVISQPEILKLMSEKNITQISVENPYSINSTENTYVVLIGQLGEVRPRAMVFQHADYRDERVIKYHAEGTISVSLTATQQMILEALMSYEVQK